MSSLVKVILLVGVLVVVAATLFADHMWRRWMAARRREHDGRENRHGG